MDRSVWITMIIIGIVGLMIVMARQSDMYSGFQVPTEIGRTDCEQGEKLYKVIKRDGEGNLIESKVECKGVPSGPYRVSP